MSDSPERATQLLERWQGGDLVARSRLMELLHAEMRGIAGRPMRRERAGHTLQPTAVVNEACMRLLGMSKAPAANRGAFLGLSARIMRQVLVDHARQRDAGKRGGDRKRVTLTRDPEADHGVEPVDALDLDAALTELAELSPRQAQVAELRYFGGLTVPETAEALGVSGRQVKREWAVARLWLWQRLDRDGERPDPETP